MPGPGGGSHSGGGFSGGHGGGFGGGNHGGFGGGMHFGGFHGGGFGRRRVRVGGGCCGNVFGVFCIGLFVFFAVLYSVLPGGTSSVLYDEETFQDYADSCYADIFGGADAYEDNLLLVVLTDEDYSYYYYIAWVGDHIDRDISDLLGDEYTELGQLMLSNISDTNYKYSLDSDLAAVVSGLEKAIGELDLESSFTCSEDRAVDASVLYNKSTTEMTADTVNSALTSFTESTGIPFAIVVDDASEVFNGKTSSASKEVSVSTVFLVVGIALLVVILVVSAVALSRRKSRGEGDFVNEERRRERRDFDDL